MAIHQYKVPVEIGQMTIDGSVTAGRLYGGIQRSTADAAFTINPTDSLVILAADVSASRIVTLPPAVAGRHFVVIWEVEQDSHNRVFTRAGSDTIGGNITTKVQGNAAGDGDVVAVATSTAAITTLPDVNIGSYLKFTCGVAAQWLVEGELVLSAVGQVPTLA